VNKILDDWIMTSMSDRGMTACHRGCFSHLRCVSSIRNGWTALRVQTLLLKETRDAGVSPKRILGYRAVYCEALVGLPPVSGIPHSSLLLSVFALSGNLKLFGYMS
jgi:hypothetical protein